MIRNRIDNNDCSFFELFNIKHSTRKNNIGFIFLIITYNSIILMYKIYNICLKINAKSSVNGGNKLLVISCV